MIPVWPTLQGAPAINLAVLDLIECACSAVAELGQGAPCFCGVYPGEQVSWEYCGSDLECGSLTCGMVYIRPGMAFPYTTFPLADPTLGCSSPMAYTIELGVLRCFPTMDEQGELPPAEDVTDAALGLADDQRALRIAIECCESLYLSTKTIVEWVPVGPTGGCVGGFWTIIVDPQNWRS